MTVNKKLPEKMKAIREEYAVLRFKAILKPAVVLRADTASKLYRSEPRDLAYAPVNAGDAWGASGITTWFVFDADVPCEGASVSLRYASADALRTDQVLVFENGVPIGVQDRNHDRVFVSGPGCRRYALEAYPFHTFPGTQPHERARAVGTDARVYLGVEISVERRDVTRFVMDLSTLLELLEILPEHDLFRGKILKGLEKVFAVVDAVPCAEDEERILAQSVAACEILRPLMEAKNGTFAASAGLVGHAHIDTAWQWTLDETVRKCARTFSSVLNLMRRYPEFTFMQGQPYQLERMREYPALYDEILRRSAQGRWEINGGMYIEPDLNLPSGEALVRQLLYGRQTTETWGKESDTLWMPDTFGFSAALPQLMLGAGIKYFSTGKLDGCDTTRFPYDSFRWKGIDGSEVVAHFSRVERGPNPSALDALWRHTQHKDIQDGVLLAFGHGDGGGGPTAEMLESAYRVKDLQGCPKGYFTTLSDFMRNIRREELPVYSGELYFQEHRGTYTAISEIKRLNRALEFKFKETEYFLTRLAVEGKPYPRERMDDLWKRFLVCQFHDILPGTAIAEVNDEAIAEMKNISQSLDGLAGLTPPSDSVTLVNYTGMPYESVLHLPAVNGCTVFGDGLFSQAYTDFNHETRAAVSGISLPPLSGKKYSLRKITEGGGSPFIYEGTHLITPVMEVRFGDKGEIISLILNGGCELAQGSLNRFWLGEDVPAAWDNWNIDCDQFLKMAPDYILLEREIISDGPVELRIRSRYALGKASLLTQDMIFFPGSLRIDFESKLDWKEKRTLLKAAFDVSVQAEEARHEIQFGYISRPTHRNEPADRAKFEVCCHKWTDVSRRDFGVAVLNDSKYGISVGGKTIALTLLKSGVHPDARGDEGIHFFTYSLLPHTGGFDAVSITREAYAVNARPALSGDGPAEPLFKISSPYITAEAVKMAQRENAVVLRICEIAGGSASAEVRPGFKFTRCWETDLLERKIKPLDSGAVAVSMKPFEIKTLLFMK